jgi:FXSXX-COOH protein
VRQPSSGGKVVPPGTVVLQNLAAFLHDPENSPQGLAVKISESPRPFAVAKNESVPLSKIDTRTAEATRKLGRVFAASTDRHSMASTFSSAL